MGLLILITIAIVFLLVYHFGLKPDYNDFEVVEIKSLNRKYQVISNEYSIFYKVKVLGLFKISTRFRDDHDIYLFPSAEIALKKYNLKIVKTNEYIHSS